MLDICLLGTGGMHPLPHRFLTSLYVKCGGRALLIDCGESTQTAMRSVFPSTVMGRDGMKETLSFREELQTF